MMKPETTALAARIHSDPEVMVGKPVIRGRRITVQLILERLAEGEAEESIMYGYGVSREDIRACLAYAAARVGRPRRRKPDTRDASPTEQPDAAPIVEPKRANRQAA